jgi:surface antigen
MKPVSRRSVLTTLFAGLPLASLAIAGVARADQPGSYAPDTSRLPNGRGWIRAKLTPEDREINRKCINKMMTEGKTGQVGRWHNPNTGNGGTVTPTGKARKSGGSVCRPFSETITLADGRSETISGQACRGADGSWQVA